MKIYGYLRVSSKSQIEGDGLNRQRDAVEAFCRAHTLDRIGMWREEGVSGTVEGLDRPEFAEMLSSIDRRATLPGGEVGAVVVERMDRLARDLMVSEVLMMELRKRNIKVFSADQGTLIDMASDGGDPTRVLIRQIMGALSQWEKSMLVKKLGAAKKRLREAGLLVEGKPAFGTLPGEDAILKFMLDSHPGMNYSQITEMMNSTHCLNRAGRPWKPQNVREVIVNARKRKVTK
jgi:DNA invertase Pin-like site-specific DNA recombinase